MAKKKALHQIATTAVINSLKVDTHKDNISFTSFNIGADDNEIIAEMVKTEAEVMVRIGLDIPKKKKAEFPDIEVKGKMKSFVINKTCDAPKIDGIQFSSGQVEQITNYIRSEEEIQLTFTQLQQELDFDNNPEGTEQK